MNICSLKPFAVFAVAVGAALAVAGCGGALFGAPDGVAPVDTPLHKAAAAGDVAEMRRLIANGADVNAQGQGGGAPLHSAADEPEAARLLIEHGANVNAKAADDDTPLHQADEPEVTALLLQHGADVHATDVNGDTPLHKADEPEAAMLLLQHGADLHAVNNLGWMPLDWAVYEKNAAMQALLRSRGGRCGKLC